MRTTPATLGGLLLLGLTAFACTSQSTPPPTPPTPPPTVSPKPSAPAVAPASTAAPEKVFRIGSFSTAIDYSPYVVAKAKGWIDESMKARGAKADYVPTFQSLPPINESFASGRVDAVFEAEVPSIVGRAAGIDIRIVSLPCSLRLDIIVPVASKAKGIADLKGKKVAVLAGTGAHYGLFNIVKAAGLKDRDIEVVDMVPPDAKSAFETGLVAGWAVWPPWPEQELVAKRARVLPGADAFIHSILAVRGAAMDADPELVRALVESIEKARTWITQNPAEAKALVASELKLAPEVVELAWPKHDFSAKLDAAVVQDIQAKADFLKRQGLIRGDVKAQGELVQPLAPKN